MTTLVLGLFILACGWKLYKDWRVTRFAALANAGHPQYFAAAIVAGYLFVLAACLQSAAHHLPFYESATSLAFGGLPVFFDKTKNETLQNILALSSIAFWAFGLTVVLGWAFNKPLFRSPELLLAVAKKVGAIDQLEELFRKCLDDGLLVALTLKSGKVYVGVGERSSSVDGDRTWVSLWPWASGYRDEKGRLEITTYYRPQYELLVQSASGIKIEDFRVVLPRSEISSAQSLDLATYHTFPGRLDEESSRSARGEAEPVSTATSASSYSQFLNNEIVTREDRYRWYFYWVYVVLVSVSILLLPESWIATIFALALARVASHEAAYE